MLQDVERFFIVRISVAVVGTEPVAGKVSLGGFVQTGGQLVGLCVPGESVGAPASGAVPHSAAAGCINVDADDKGVVGFVTVTDGHTIDTSAAFLQGDVLLFGHDKRCVVTTALQMLHDGSSNQAVVLVLPEASVRRAFARGLDPVAVVYQDFHCSDSLRVTETSSRSNSSMSAATSVQYSGEMYLRISAMIGFSCICCIGCIVCDTDDTSDTGGRSFSFCQRMRTSAMSAPELSSSSVAFC